MKSLSRAMNATDKAKLIDRIKSIDGLTDDERSALLGLLNESKTYGLVWEDKPEEVEERLRTELPVLKEVKSRAIISGNADTPNHILIEGDNLEALTTLAYTHEGKIDVIYIDPPYNTGNKDFIYDDRYVDTEDSYRHSKWLSFMEKRLRIAKKLLSDRGVIYISIDDNEQANLKLLCDEIFRIANFICVFIWQQGKKSSGNLVGVNHEYILCYAKNRALIDNPQAEWKTKKLGLEKIYAKYDELKKKYGSNHITIQKEIRSFFSSLADNDPAFKSKHYNSVDEKGLFFADNSCAPDRPESRCHKPLIHPITGKPTAVPKLGWRWKEETLDNLVKDGRIFFGNTETIVPKVKKYLREMEYEMPSSVFYKDGRGASLELDSILGNKLFSNPKDRNILMNLLSYKENNIVLDFFAGSGTTLHAVMQLNAEDGGHRQCILCTNNENGICENVTYERNKRVIQGYTKPNGEFVEGLHDNNLRYYRTAYVGRRRTPQNMRRLMLLASDMLCIKEDLYKEIDEFAGMPTLENGFRFFDDGKKQMLIIYNEEAIYEIVEAIEKINVERPIITYVFSPANDPWRLEFESVSEKVELTALPAAIYNAYKRVLPKAKDLLLSTPPESQPPKKEVPDNLFDFEEEKEEKGGEE